MMAGVAMTNVPLDGRSKVGVSADNKTALTGAVFVVGTGQGARSEVLLDHTVMFTHSSRHR